MDGYNTLHNMLESALKQAGEESGMLLGQDLSISLSDTITTTKTSYFGDLDDSCFVMGVDSREAYSGQFYLLFSLRDAIVLSSILLGIPPARIQEKKRLAIIENDDIDAFSEIANMINGSFNTVFQGTLPNKVHLKLLPPKKFVPDIDPLTEDEPLAEGEYLMFRSKLEMAGQELNHLDVLIPVALGNLFDPPAVSPVLSDVDETDESSTTAESQDTAGVKETLGTSTFSDANGIESIIVLEDNPDERRQLVESLTFTGYHVVEGTLDDDIKALFADWKVKLVIIGSLDADDRELAVCIKVNAMRQDSPPPVIMSAQRWTRTAVLKALKYGARDIMMTPCAPEEVAAKVKRYCKQAEQ
ncbi:response regulator [Pelotalea chapellei]|uniref:Response regulator n=1 Tax=Pelotalea chapellei TaxID=44671 RepID=A0ABS5U8F2_9BACT|nr:response regulator [Pelotalea chapellei]MBT1071957.1 response regulator [Pelotalea chapellei]